MIAQYTQAALVAENRRLAAPASVGSIPTSAMQEDHVSMGWGAARRLRPMLANLARILAVELACAARGLELRAPLAPGAGTARRAGAAARRRRRPRRRPLARARPRRRRAARALGRAGGRRRERDGVARVTLRITHHTDPACPFAFSAEPVRTRVRWHYGDQLEWRHVMIVLTDGDRREAEGLAEGAPTLQRLYGMPIDPAPRRRPASSEPGCRAVIAARLFAAAESEERLLRSLRVRGMAGALLDDPDLIAAAAADAGIDAGSSSPAGSRIRV